MEPLTVLLTLMTVTSSSMAFIFPEYFDGGDAHCSNPPCGPRAVKKAVDLGRESLVYPELEAPITICRGHCM